MHSDDAFTGSGATPSPLGQTLLAAARQDASWLVQLEGDKQQTLTTSEVIDAYNERRIDPETYVWAEGMSDWEQLQSVDALVDALHAQADEVPAAPAQPVAETPPQSEQTFMFAPASAPQTKDDSAIFSLAMLVGDAHDRDESGEPREDSGLIDLAALQASAQAVPEPLHEPLAPMDLFPSPVANPVVAVAEPPAPSGNTRALVGALVAALVVLSALLVFQVTKSSGEVATDAPSPPATSAPEVETTETVAPPAATTPAPAAEKPAPAVSATASAEVETKPPQRVATGPTTRQPTHVPRTTQPPSRTDAKPKTKSKKKAPAKPSGCGCKQGDLDCFMRCSVHGK